MESGSIGSVSSLYGSYFAHSPSSGSIRPGRDVTAAAQNQIGGKGDGTGTAVNSTSDVKIGKGDQATNDPAVQQQIRKLEEIDRKVRAHEQAHIAAAAGLSVSSANFQYTQGPDGKKYAVGGEVSIDVSEGRTPEETIDKATRIRAAALAPADPSGQDRAVAAMATQMQAAAQVELGSQRAEAGESRKEGGKDVIRSSAARDEGNRFQLTQALAAYEGQSRLSNSRSPSSFSTFA